MAFHHIQWKTIESKAVFTEGFKRVKTSYCSNQQKKVNAMVRGFCGFYLKTAWKTCEDSVCFTVLCDKYLQNLKEKEPGKQEEGKKKYFVHVHPPKLETFRKLTSITL